MSTVIETHRPGPASWLTFIRCEAKMVVRDTAGLGVPLVLPLLILVTNASAASGEIVTSGRTVLDLFVLPLVLTMVIAIIGIVNMPSFLAYYRRAGILRRLAVTPATPIMVLVAWVVVSIIQAVIGITPALLVAVLAFGANPPIHPGAALGVFVAAMAGMYALGMVVAAIAPTPNSAVAIGLILFFALDALGALGGMFGGRDALTDSLAILGAWLPFGATVEALSAAWAGLAIDPAHWMSLGITTVIGIGVAAMLFRWD
jgi:ABC-2 type transport system permease protein